MNVVNIVWRVFQVILGRTGPLSTVCPRMMLEEEGLPPFQGARTGTTTHRKQNPLSNERIAWPYTNYWPNPVGLALWGLPLNLKTAVARAESSHGLGIMTAYRGGTDHLFGYAPPLCTALIRKPLENLQHAQPPFTG